MKAYKVELLIVDHDDVGDEIPNIIENQKYPNYCISPNVMSVQSVDIGEWFDGHPLNKRDKQGAYYRQAFNIDLEKEILETKFNNLQKLHAESMRMWEKEKPSATEMELAMLKLNLEPCTVDGGDMKNNTIILKFDNADKVAGIRLGNRAQIIVERK
jgi:hypothetical protein